MRSEGNTLFYIGEHLNAKTESFLKGDNGTGTFKRKGAETRRF